MRQTLSIIAAAIMFASSPATAGTRWTLFNDDAGCGIKGQFGDDGYSQVVLVGFPNGDYFLDISNGNWSIAPTKTYPLVFRFDDELMQGEATGYSEDRRGGFRIRGGGELATSFAKSKNLTVMHKVERPNMVVHVGLLGSSAGVSQLDTCLERLKISQAKADAEDRALQEKRAVIPADPFFNAEDAVPLGSISNWITPDDYPPRALREGREGETRFKLTIATSGAVSACDVLASSGHADLDAATCGLLTRRARFSAIPVKAANRYYRHVMRWQIVAPTPP
jgi:TonB family protein